MDYQLNRTAADLIKRALSSANRLKIRSEKGPLGCTIIDAGVNEEGGYAAGEMVAQACMGGYGTVALADAQYDDLSLPSAHVYTDLPGVATLGSQFAGWQIKTEDFFALGSGPARAIALKPKELYQKIDYRETADQAVLVLETEKYPTESAVRYVADHCKVSPEETYFVCAATQSIAGSVQIAARIVETGVHKLTDLGFDPKKILYGLGHAPIAPLHPKSTRAMGRTNDAIIFCGRVSFTVKTDTSESLQELIKKAPALASSSYGKPFYEIFKESGFDFYKIDPGLFAPALVEVNDVTTGKTYRAGRINTSLLRQSFDIQDIA